MKKNATTQIILGGGLLFLFIAWTCLVKTVDVQPLGVNGTDIGLSKLNLWFHKLIGVRMWLYVVTDWAGLIPVFIGVASGVKGLYQLIKRKNILKVDGDILVLGVYYIVVFAFYFIFEKIDVNYRPVLIDGGMEKSYPSSTTLLVLTIMPAFIERIRRKMDNPLLKTLISVVSITFIIFTVGGRLISGVHWLTDIIGGVLLSIGLFLLYKGTVKFVAKITP